MSGDLRRCPWCDPASELYVRYHDEEWGIPQTDDRRLYEMLVLEGMQAGLSWLTVLRKRQHFRLAFDNFAVQEVARYDDDKVAALMADSGIIRNRMKIEAAITNARIVMALQDEYGSFARYLWEFVDATPLQNNFARAEEVPAQTPLSEKISRDMKKRGMRFVGPTIIYAFMQAVGMVNDHLRSCPRYEPCRRLGSERVRW